VRSSGFQKQKKGGENSDPRMKQTKKKTWGKRANCYFTKAASACRDRTHKKTNMEMDKKQKKQPNSVLVNKGGDTGTGAREV